MNSAAGYAARAATYAAEVAAGLTTPHLLKRLLSPGMTVAEIPSGAGHYPRVYADAGCTTMLIDASAEILDAAAVNTAGVPNVRRLHARLETLTADVVLADLIVVPNGALNQLAHDLPLPEIFRSLVGVLAPEGRILVQALLGEPGEACGFYEPLRGGSWFTDRRIPDPSGGTLVRRRRQNRHDDLVGIDFTLHRDDTQIYEHTVALLLLDRPSITQAAAVAGLTVATYRPGLGQLTEVVLGASA